MKKLFSLLVLVVFMITLVGCGSGNTLVVYTEAGFAPFEYVKDGQIVGVDVDIMNKVGEKLNKKVVFENVAFDTIIDAARYFSKDKYNPRYVQNSIYRALKGMRNSYKGYYWKYI